MYMELSKPRGACANRSLPGDAGDFDKRWCSCGKRVVAITLPPSLIPTTARIGWTVVQPEQRGCPSRCHPERSEEPALSVNEGASHKMEGSVPVARRLLCLLRSLAMTKGGCHCEERLLRRSNLLRGAKGLLRLLRSLAMTKGGCHCEERLLRRSNLLRGAKGLLRLLRSLAMTKGGCHCEERLLRRSNLLVAQEIVSSLPTMTIVPWANYYSPLPRAHAIRSPSVAGPIHIYECDHRPALPCGTF